MRDGRSAGNAGWEGAAVGAAVVSRETLEVGWSGSLSETDRLSDVVVAIMSELAVTTPLNWEATEAVVEKESVVSSVCEDEPPAETDSDAATELDALKGEDGNAREVVPETVTLPEEGVAVAEMVPDTVLVPDAMDVTEAVADTESVPESVWLWLSDCEPLTDVTTVPDTVEEPDSVTVAEADPEIPVTDSVWLMLVGRVFVSVCDAEPEFEWESEIVEPTEVTGPLVVTEAELGTLVGGGCDTVPDVSLLLIVTELESDTVVPEGELDGGGWNMLDIMLLKGDPSLELWVIELGVDAIVPEGALDGGGWNTLDRTLDKDPELSLVLGAAELGPDVIESEEGTLDGGGWNILDIMLGTTLGIMLPDPSLMLALAEDGREEGTEDWLSVRVGVPVAEGLTDDGAPVAEALSEIEAAELEESVGADVAGSELIAVGVAVSVGVRVADSEVVGANALDIPLIADETMLPTSDVKLCKMPPLLEGAEVIDEAPASDVRLAVLLTELCGAELMNESDEAEESTGAELLALAGVETDGVGEASLEAAVAEDESGLDAEAEGEGEEESEIESEAEAETEAEAEDAGVGGVVGTTMPGSVELAGTKAVIPGIPNGLAKGSPPAWSPPFPDPW
jgi:hypothetical protein